MKNKLKIIKILFVVFLFYTSIKTLQNHELFLLSGINLNIHEAGHPIFMIIFGEFVGFLGGTLMQIIIPFVFFVYFFYRRELYSSFVMTWWLGESLIGISRYISDARAQILPLIGGEHDWYFLLSKTNMLTYDTILGNITFFLGISIMFFSLIACLFFTFKKFLFTIKTSSV